MELSFAGPTSFAMAAAIAVAGSFAALRIGKHLRIWDLPGDGRTHLRPAVRLGGPAILPAFLIVLILTSENSGQFVGLAICAVFITGIGLADDIKGLAPWHKLAGQTAVALLALAVGVQISFVSNPFGGVLELGVLAGGVLTVFWLVGMMNAINLLDGLDGLAPGVVLVAALVMAILSARLGAFSLVLFGMALAGAIFGFLPFNAYRARLFLGDSGSNLLGFLIGSLAVLGQAKIGTALLVLGIPILDVAFTMVRRWISGHGIMSRDTSHLHHRLLDAGLARWQVTAIYVALCGAFGTSALLIERTGKLAAIGVLAAVTTGLLYVAAKRVRIRD